MEGVKVRLVLHGTEAGLERLLKADKEKLSKAIGHKIISIERVPPDDKPINPVHGVDIKV